MNRIFIFLQIILLEAWDFLRQFFIHISVILIAGVLWHYYFLLPLFSKIQEGEITQISLTQHQGVMDRLKGVPQEQLFRFSDSISVVTLETIIYQWVHKHQSIHLVELTNLDGPLNRLIQSGFYGDNGNNPAGPNAPPPTLSPIMSTAQLLTYAIDNSTQWQRHEVSVVIEGDYFQIMTFLQQLQLNSIFWKSMEYHVVKYSLAHVKVILYCYEKI